MALYRAVYLIDPCGTTKAVEIEADDMGEAAVIANFNRRRFVGNGILGDIEVA